MRSKNVHHVYTVESAIDLIVSSDHALKQRWDSYSWKEYGDTVHFSERLLYTDIGEICRYIIEKWKTNETQSFPQIFSNLEQILGSCDVQTKNLITTGLFEGIQNIGGKDIDYYYGFNKWLGAVSGEQWRAVIDFWEGKEWRSTSPQHKKYNK